MNRAIGAAEANRQFSDVLRQVRGGASFTITSHGRPVAHIVPVRPTETLKMWGRDTLLKRLRRSPVVDAERWTRDELYDE
jgi:prevent-host-death family protein